MSCGVKLRNSKCYHKDGGCYRAKNLQQDIYLGRKIASEGYNFRGLDFSILRMSRENQELMPFLPQNL